MDRGDAWWGTSRAHARMLASRRRLTGEVGWKMGTSCPVDDTTIHGVLEDTYRPYAKTKRLITYDAKGQREENRICWECWKRQR